MPENAARFASIHSYLLALTDSLKNFADPETIKEEACRSLAHFLAAGQVAYAEIEGDHALIERDWNDGSIPSNAGRHRLLDFGRQLVDELASGSPVIVIDVAADFRTISPGIRDHFTSVSIGAFINVPLVKDGVLTAVLAVHKRDPHAWTDDQILASVETAERTWAAVERSRAERRLHQTDRRFELALAHSPIVVFEQDLDLRYTWIFNPQLGYRSEEILGKTDAELMDPDAATELDAVKRECIASLLPVRKEVTAFGLGQAPRFYDLFVEPRLDDNGSVVGIVASATDITERVASETQIRRAHDSYLRLIENNPFGVYLIDSNFCLIQVSQGTKRVFSNAKPLLGRDFAEIVRTIWSEPFASEVIRRFRHTLLTGESYHAPNTRERRGDVDAVEGYDWRIERVYLPNGDLGVVCYFYDLTERQAHEEQVRLLLLETTHRSKNLLSLVAAIARNTDNGDPEDFLERFEQRIYALAASHDLLLNSNYKNVSLDQLIRSQLAHFNDLLDVRITLQGPELQITSRAAQAIGMAIFELATNAGKYGALSRPLGTVELSWNVSGDADDDRFTLTWIEKGGPLVEQPTRRGFGSKVTGSLIKSSLNANVSIFYDEAGVRWVVECSAQSVIEVLVSTLN